MKTVEKLGKVCIIIRTCWHVVLAVVAPLPVWAADVPKEVEAQVQARLGDGKLEPPIVDTGKVMAGTYVYFVSHDVPLGDSAETTLDAHMLFADHNGKWHDVWFDRYDEDGGVPEIASVFFANISQGKQRETALAILVRTPQQHYDYSGAFYDGYVYNVTGAPYAGAVFVGLQRDASKPFGGQCDCGFRDGRTERAPYATAASMRRAIEQRAGVHP